MEYKNVDGVFSWNNDTFKANCKVEFDNDGLITLESISNEPVFCNEYDHRYYEFGNFSGTTDNGEQVDLKKVTMESYKQIHPNSFEFNVLYKSYEGSIYFDKNIKIDKTIFGLVNFIADIPESYTIELDEINIRIYHLQDFKNNKQKFLTGIKNKGEILLTSEIEITGTNITNYDTTKKNRFCDYITYLLSLLSNNYSVWIYRKDFSDDKLVSRQPSTAG